MRKRLTDVLGMLKSGVSDALQDLEQFQREESSSTFKNAIEELKSNAAFLDQIESWLDTMPVERLREVLLACVNTLRKSFRALLESGKVRTLPQQEIEGDSLPAFMVQVLERLGPRLFVREDKMRASIQIDRKERPFWNRENVEAFLEREGIVYGVDREALKRIFDQELFDQSLVVAQGTKPVAGKKGYVRYTFDVDQLSGRPKELASGRVDHKELNLFHFVSAGCLLAERVPPEPGVPGATIYGEEIPTEGGVPAELIASENTVLSEDGNRLTARAEGYLSVQGAVISVKPSVLIPGDVSYSTGNISSPIGVTVQGNVLSGFRVYSKESVNVSGLVEAAKIIAEGDIAINGGVEGKGKALLQATGSVRAHFLNDVRVRCNGSVRAAGSIFHCAVACGESVFAEGDHGHVTEGIIRAEDEVWAEEIGSEMGVKTRIELGIVTLGMPAKIEELRRRAAELEEKWKRSTMATEKLARLKKARGTLDAEKENSLNRALGAAKKLKELMASKLEEAQALEEAHTAGLRKMRFVKARRRIWPGTEIRILETDYIVRNPTGPATVTLLDGQIQILPYSDAGGHH
jgi:hypothetical protein